MTEETLIEGTDSGMGVAVGDYDHDGWVDLYVTAFGENRLYRNAGDGSFEPPKKLFGHRNHLNGPSIMDWNADGFPDIIVGEAPGAGADGIAGELKGEICIVYGQKTAVPPAKLK